VHDLRLATLSGSEMVLPHSVVGAFRSRIRGRVVDPGENGYDNARSVFNAIDRRPGLIVQCEDMEHVMAAVAFVRDHDLLASIRGGGHGVSANAVCDGGLVIDLSRMKSVWVDPANRTARAQGGATWGDFDRETQAFGLASTGGIVPTTGIAGLTLGGGIGYLNRKLGLACDNLISADVVTATAGI